MWLNLLLWDLFNCKWLAPGLWSFALYVTLKWVPTIWMYWNNLWVKTIVCNHMQEKRWNLFCRRRVVRHSVLRPHERLSLHYRCLQMVSNYFRSLFWRSNHWSMDQISQKMAVHSSVALAEESFLQHLVPESIRPFIWFGNWEPKSALLVILTDGWHSISFRRKCVKEVLER